MARGSGEIADVVALFLIVLFFATSCTDYGVRFRVNGEPIQIKIGIEDTDGE